MKKAAKLLIAATIGTLSAIYASNTTLYKEFEERQAYKEEILEQGAVVRPEFEKALEKSIEDIKNKNYHIVIRSADWCIPCKGLEAHLEQQGTRNSIVILEAHGRLEEIKSRLAFERLGIKTPAMPTIIIKEQGRINVYVGARYSTANPKQYVTFDETGRETNIDKIIKK